MLPAHDERWFQNPLMDDLDPLFVASNSTTTGFWDGLQCEARYGVDTSEGVR